MIRPALLLWLLLTSLIGFAQTTGIDQHNVRQFKLDNGLTVLIYPNHSLPEVLGMVVVKAGGKDDPSDATGMAHYMEHMLFKGTSELGTTNYQLEKPLIDSIFIMYDSLGKTNDPIQRQAIQGEINRLSLAANEYAIPNEFSNLIKSIGGTGLNAGTGPDQTVYYNEFPPYQLEKWLDLYSHRFIDPVFRSFQAELEVVYEEKNMYSDMFFTGLLEDYQRQFFKKHPYGQKTLIGTAEDLKNPSLTKMYQFFKEWYVPSNMALILVGDIDPGQAEPMIIKYFGRLQDGQPKEHIIYPEEAFKGREYHEGNLSPIRLVLLGYRTVPSGHPDELPLQLANQMLNNSNETGLFDNLTLNNELMGAIALPLPYQDHGGTVFLGIPKIVGQSMEEAEDLMRKQLEKLRKGEFSDTLLEAIKLREYREHQVSLESNTSFAMILAESFSTGKPLEDYLDYANRVKSITKEDIVRVVNKYYGEDYLAFYSKIGFKPKDKIEKPGYEPIPAKNEVKSAYTLQLDKIQTPEPQFQFVDMGHDVHFSNLLKHDFYHTRNQVNDIFTFVIKYQVGSHEIPLLEQSAALMNTAGAGQYDMAGFKKAFEAIGCTYSINADESYVYVQMTGIDSKFKEAVSLLNLLLKQPNLDEKKLKVLLNGEQTNRVIERTQPDMVSAALNEYVMYKERSAYLTRPTLKQLKGLTTQSVLDTFARVLDYRCIYHYVGTLSPEVTKEIISEIIQPPTHPKQAQVPYIKSLEQYDQNMVFVVSKKKARQSKIMLYSKGPVYMKEQKPVYDAFNLYYGGDFSGLVLQEIREYRSMAYGADGRFMIPGLPGKMTWFQGYVATQSDKTVDALSVYDTLIREMPQKPERMEFIKPYLVQQLSTSRPGFRQISNTVEYWKRFGYNEDPGISRLKDYRAMEWPQVYEFYEKNLRKANIAIAIVGDSREFDLKSLERFGQVVVIKEKKLFN
jgi:zinc protease